MSLPASRNTKRRPVYERYLRRRHHMLSESEVPSTEEISDAQALLASSWDDELREEALDILRCAGFPRSGDLKESRR